MIIAIYPLRTHHRQVRITNRLRVRANSVRCSCTRAPAQSVATVVAADGLLPRLGIDRFHAPRHRNVLSPHQATGLTQMDHKRSDAQ